MNIEEIAIRLSQQISPDGWLCGSDPVIEYTHALLAELSKDDMPFGYYENGRWSVNVDGGPDKYRKRKEYCGPLFTRPANTAEIEQRVAEALLIAVGEIKCVGQEGLHDFTALNIQAQVLNILISGKWREYL